MLHREDVQVGIGEYRVIHLKWLFCSCLSRMCFDINVLKNIEKAEQSGAKME